MDRATIDANAVALRIAHVDDVKLGVVGTLYDGVVAVHAWIVEANVIVCLAADSDDSVTDRIRGSTVMRELEDADLAGDRSGERLCRRRA